MSTASNAQGYVIAEWGYKRKGWRNAYTLLDNTIEYDKSLCQGFQERWEQQPGAKIIGKDVFKQDDPSIAAQIARNSTREPARRTVENQPTRSIIQTSIASPSPLL